MELCFRVNSDVVSNPGGFYLRAGTNRIDRFERVPSELRRYLEYMTQIKSEHGSVMRFVMKERLGWGNGDLDDLKPRGRPFEVEGMDGQRSEEEDG